MPILYGRLTAADYEDGIARDPRIDALRARIVCMEDPAFTADYHDPAKRSIANALTVEFNDGSSLDEIVLRVPDRPPPPPRRRYPAAGSEIPPNLTRVFPARQQERILDASLDQRKLETMPVNEYVDLYVI